MQICYWMLLQQVICHLKAMLNLQMSWMRSSSRHQRVFYWKKNYMKIWIYHDFGISIFLRNLQLRFRRIIIYHREGGGVVSQYIFRYMMKWGRGFKKIHYIWTNQFCISGVWSSTCWYHEGFYIQWGKGSHQNQAPHEGGRVSFNFESSFERAVPLKWRPAGTTPNPTQVINIDQSLTLPIADWARNDRQ